MGVNGAYNTVGENVSAYNTAWVLSCQGGHRVLFLQVYRVWSLVLWFDLCALLCFLRPLPNPFRVGVPGRLVLVVSGRASCRRAVSRVFASLGWRCGVRVESGASARPSDRRGRPAVTGVQSERSGRRGGLESESRGHSSLAGPSFSNTTSFKPLTKSCLTILFNCFIPT